MPTGLERWARHWTRSRKAPLALIFSISSTLLPLSQEASASVRVDGRYLRTSFFLIAAYSAFACTSAVVGCFGASRSPTWQVTHAPPVRTRGAPGCSGLRSHWKVDCAG